MTKKERNKLMQQKNLANSSLLSSSLLQAQTMLASHLLTRNAYDNAIAKNSEKKLNYLNKKRFTK
jgi:hypothetical protein